MPNFTNTMPQSVLVNLTDLLIIQRPIEGYNWDSVLVRLDSEGLTINQLIYVIEKVENISTSFARDMLAQSKVYGPMVRETQILLHHMLCSFSGLL